jgi:hypothetical protein
MIFASLGLDWGNFQRGIQGAMASTRQLGSTMQQSSSGGMFGGLTSAISNISAMAVAMKVATFAATGLMDAIQFADDLVDLNAQTGVAVDKLMELQMAFELNGMKAENVQPVLAKMQKLIADAASGSAEAAAKFAAMGISIDEIQGLTADKQLMKIGEAIKRIENPAQRAAAAMEIFGKSGAKLLSVFGSGGKDDPGGMKEVRKMLGNQTALLLENAGVFARASDLLGLAGSKLRGFFVGMASEIVPQLMEVIDATAGIDLSSIGQAFGGAIAFWINYFENFGSTGDLIYNTMKLAFQGAINFLTQELSVMFATAAAEWKNVFSSEKDTQAAVRQAENEARAGAPTIDTTATENKIQAAMDAINASKEATAAAARKKYGTPDESLTGLDIARKAGAAMTGAPGMGDISSLQKIGGGASLLAGMQTNSPAYQSVKVQEEIRDYVIDLIETVKQGGQSYQISPNTGGGMILTA